METDAEVCSWGVGSCSGMSQLHCGISKVLTCDAIVVGASCSALNLEPGFENVQRADESCRESPSYCTSNEAHNLGVIPVFVLPRLCPGW